MAGSINVHVQFLCILDMDMYARLLCCYAMLLLVEIDERKITTKRRDDDLRPSTESSCVGCISIYLLGGCSVSCLLINSVKAAFTAQCVEELS